MYHFIDDGRRRKDDGDDDGRVLKRSKISVSSMTTENGDPPSHNLAGTESGV